MNTIEPHTLTLENIKPQLQTNQRYKFLRERDGKIQSDWGKHTWTLGEWKSTNDEEKLALYKTGFHCSKQAYHAFSYVQGNILALVEVEGESITDDKKEVWQQMRLIKAWKWQRQDTVALAIYAAELVLARFENSYPKDKRPRHAIEAAQKWLANPIEKNRTATIDAAAAVESPGAGTWAKADAAARAGAAAWLAARAVTAREEWTAAWVAARVDETTIEKISAWMDERIVTLAAYVPVEVTR